MNLHLCKKERIDFFNKKKKKERIAEIVQAQVLNSKGTSCCEAQVGLAQSIKHKRPYLLGRRGDMKSKQVVPLVVRSKQNVHFILPKRPKVCRDFA